MNKRISELVEQTPFVDTHEHLIEESQRLSGRLEDLAFPLFACNDWAYLFMQYLGDDLYNSGMPTAPDYERFFSPTGSAEDKYRLVAPYWERCRHTGYAQAVRRTLRKLYGEDDLTAASAPRIAQKYRAMIKPGFYRKILCDLSNIESCQVNSLQRTFFETEQPDLLPQDLSIRRLGRCSAQDLDVIESESGKRPKTLGGWLDLIDWHFATYGPRAVAVKCPNAYVRRLDYQFVPRARVEVFYKRQASGYVIGHDDSKSLNDYLFRYCLTKATEHGLPVKLHTGTYGGRDFLPLERTRHNATDVGILLKDYPDTKFVLMHIGYPYQDEFLALGKQYHNAYIDMCWTWIMNPAVGVRFLKEFLVAVPVNKIFTFGGDYIAVETVYGHSEIARQGITQAISELVAEGWVALEETPDIIERIMRANAGTVFPKAKNTVRQSAGS